jgi:16S rRNA (guanine527-N7)-methyltransferase
LNEAAAPTAPAEAHDVFGASFDTAEAFARILVGAAVERGLLGPREVDRIWDRHLINCAVVAEIVPEDAHVVDIGSGAGLPGIVLGILRPDIRVTLLEPLLRRTNFLAECVRELELAHVEVVRGRAEEYAGKLVADIVTARAVAPLDRLANWALPLLRPGGALLALKGDRAAAELAEASETLRSHAVRDAGVVQVGQSRVNPATTIVRVIAGSQRKGRRDRKR